MIVHKYNPALEGRDVEGLGILGYPWLHSKFKVNLGYTRLCPRKKGTKELMFAFISEQTDIQSCACSQLVN